jgi:tetratricopeptide (TPR) repeat protein
MMRRWMLSTLLAALVAAPFAPARAEGDGLARAVAGSEAEAKGDFDAWLGELVSATAASPESPFAEASLSKIRAVMAGAGDPTVVEKALEPVLARGVRDGEIDEALRDVLADRARARGEFEKAEKLGQDRGYVRRFAVTGPFGWPAGVLVHRKYAPEKRELDPAAPMDGAWGPVRWMPVPQLGENAWIAPMEQIRRGEGVTYSLARLKSPSARTVALKVYCNDSFAVWVDGVRSILADRERDQVGNVVWAAARLEAGWNRVLVKVAGDAPFALKLADPETGLPVLDVEEGDPLAGAEMPALTGDADPLGYKTPADRALAAAKSDPASSAAAAYVCDHEGRAWDAYQAFDSAASSAGDGDKALAGNVHAAYGRFLATFREFPEVQRKLLAKTQFEEAAKAYPTHNSARLRLAEYMNDDDHPDAAVKSLREQVKAQPTPSAWMAMARIEKQHGWEKEAIESATAALKVAPNDLEALRFLLEYDKKYANASEEEARTKRILAVDANDGAANGEVVSQLREQGKHEEALKLVRSFEARWPASLHWRAVEANLLQSLDKDDEALAVWRGLAALVPLEQSYPRTIGQILEKKGDKAGAVESYRKSLACEPFQPSLWRDVARLEGTDVDFAAAYEPNVEEILAKLPSTDELKKKYPKAVAITVLDHDVTRVRPDGSSQNYIHMVWKLLDENAVKKYADVQNEGELLEVRAILPDGRVMAPSGIPGRSYNMEGLVPGTIIEHRYLQSNAPSEKGFDGGLFYFQDADFHDEPNPVVLSRFVVLSPESMKLAPTKRNYDAEPTVETKDGWTVTTWEKRDMPRIEPERYMPDVQEIVPLVDYTKQEDFDDVNWQLLGRRENTRPTPLLAQAAAKVLKDGMTDMEKLHALYDFVNDEITGQDRGGEGPTATLLAKAGDRGGLFEALVRIAGIPYRTGRAMAWNGEGRTGPMRVSAQTFGMPFLWLEPKGAEPLPFVMMSRLSPFGLMPDSYRGSAAYLCDESGGSIRKLPEGGPDTQDYTQFEVHLGSDAKSSTVSGSVHFRGAQDYETKRGVMEAPEDDRRKWAERTLNRYFASPSLDKVEFPGLEKRGEPFVMDLSGTMANYVQAQGDSYVVALGLPHISMAQRYVERAERVYDLVINARDDRLDEFTIVLGDAFQVKSLPEDEIVFQRLGTYSLTWRDMGDRVAVRREAHMHPARYRADEYKAFVAWCKSIDDAEERKLELRKVK